MSIPKSADVTGGIANRNMKPYGNLTLATCMPASYFHMEMFKNIAKGSSFRKVLWRLGFHCPTNADAVNQYTSYLATLGEKPGPDQGVWDTGWLEWQVAQGNVVAWSQIDTWSPGVEDRLHEAMIRYHGVLLAGELTSRSLSSTGTWQVGPAAADTPNQNLGHAVALCRYTPFIDQCVTWGYRQNMTPDYRNACFKGAFVFLLTSEKNDPDFAANLAEMKSWVGVQRGGV